VPPTSEQTRIASEIERSTARIDEALGVLERELAAIREFYVRTVADVFTGKIDVRDAASKLSDQPARGQLQEDDALFGADEEDVELETTEAAE
jgi:type I restriction enzyme S subunit